MVRCVRSAGNQALEVRQLASNRGGNLELAKQREAFWMVCGQ
jgi:hypothetical protein